MLEQNTTKMGQVNNIQLKFEASNKNEYKVYEIWDSAIYVRESAKQLLELYYLVL